MADAVLTDRRAPATCAGCGNALGSGETGPVSGCAPCEMLMVWSAAYHRWLPLLPPRYPRDDCFKVLCDASPDGGRARLVEGRLRLIPCARSEDHRGDRLSMLMDLLPSNLPKSVLTAPVKGSPESGNNNLNLDTATAMAADGDAADPGFATEPLEPERVWYYPVWQFTFAVDYKERAGCVDAVWGKPMGPAQPPNRSRPVIGAMGAGALAYIPAYMATSLAIPPLAAALISGLLGWGISRFTFSRLVHKARNR